MSDDQNLTDNLSATNDAMQGIITAANNGQFVITPDAGDELIQIFQEIEDWASNIRLDIDSIKQQTPLGNSPAGKAISEFNQKVAAGDSESYENMINQIRENAPKVVESIRKGMKIYQEADESNSSNIDGIA
ncbi:DNA-binding ferritin-like protein [Actinopolyspora lacussalsi]|nr:DNA-binding ferritin-like protein [Actinopolyspora lacussalsi]